MNKLDLIKAIRELNFTASVDFLLQFNEDELQAYLDHLLEVDNSDLTAVAPAVPYN